MAGRKPRGLGSRWRGQKSPETDAETPAKSKAPGWPWVEEQPSAASAETTEMAPEEATTEEAPAPVAETTPDAPGHDAPGDVGDEASTESENEAAPVVAALADAAKAQRKRRFRRERRPAPIVEPADAELTEAGAHADDSAPVAEELEPAVAEAPSSEPVVEEPVAEEPAAPVAEVTPRAEDVAHEAATSDEDSSAGAAAVVAAMVDTSPEQSRKAGIGRFLGTKQVAAVILLLLAAEVGYVIDLNVSSNSKSAAPPSLTIPPQSTTTVQPATSPASNTPTTTVPKAAPAQPATSPAAQTVVTSAPVACTQQDVNIVTTTDAASYKVGQPVTMTTTVSDVRPCIFNPVTPAAGSYCMVVAQNGTQVWPTATTVEQCNMPAGQTMNPGSEESFAVVWKTASASANPYTAVGTWTWDGPGGSPITVHIASAPFTVS